PTGFAGYVIRYPKVFTANFVSTLSPTVLNEARFGLRTGPVDDLQAYDVPGQEAQVNQYLQHYGSIPARVLPSIIPVSAYADTNGSIGNNSPLWTYGDSLSFTMGKHAFKGGAEFRY